MPAPEPTLKRTSVQIKYTSSDGYRADFCTKAGEGIISGMSGEPVPPQRALIAGLDELARLAALFGFEDEGRKACNDAFARVAEWRKKQSAGEIGQPLNTIERSYKSMI